MNTNGTLQVKALKCLIIILCNAFLLAGVCGCAQGYSYSSSAIKMNFVDSDTGKPLEGVMVLASWNTYTPGVELFPNITGHGGPQPSCAQLANVETAVSGTDGVAMLQAWSARGNCKFMYSYQPRIVVYKPGYQMLGNNDVNNPYNFGGVVFGIKRPSWNGKTFRLIKLDHSTTKDGEDAQIANLSRYISNVFDAAITQVHPTKCFWAEARPAFIMAMREERRLDRFFRDSPNREFTHGFRLMEQEIDESYAPGFYEVGDFTCGETTTYLKSLLKEVDGAVPENGPLW